MRKTLCRAAEINFIPKDTHILPAGKSFDFQKRILRHLQWYCGMLWTFFTFLYHREWLCSWSLPFNYFSICIIPGRHLHSVKKKKKSLCFCFLLFSFCYWRFLCQSLLACFFDSNCSPKALNLSPVRDDLSSLLFHSVFVKRHMMVTLSYSSPCMVKSKSMSKWCSYKTFLIAFLYKDI